MTTPEATPVRPCPSEVGVLGGTGKLGRGLVLRLALAGVTVRLGSRDADRAAARAEELGAKLPAEAAARLQGVSNEDAARAPLVIVAVPAEGALQLLGGLHDALRDAVVLSTVVPLAFDGAGPHLEVAPDGRSFAEQLADVLPEPRIVAGLHAVSSATLGRVERELVDDVLLCGDDEDAVATAAGVVETLGLRPVAAGPLRLARSLEALTPLLIAVNQRHGVHAGVALTGV